MRRPIIGSVMLLLFSSLALAQGRRVVQITSVEGTAVGTQANSVSVMWDDGAGKHQTVFIARNGRDQFIMLPPRPTSAPMAESVPVPRDNVLGYEMIDRLRPAAMNGRPQPTSEHIRLQTALGAIAGTEAKAGDTILGYRTVIQDAGPMTIHYSEQLGIALKFVSPEGVTEVLLVDDQADFDPRTVDLNVFEQLAVMAEDDGQKLYAEQIRDLIEQWKRALSSLPQTSR